MKMRWRFIGNSGLDRIQLKYASRGHQTQRLITHIPTRSGGVSHLEQFVDNLAGTGGAGKPIGADSRFRRDIHRVKQRCREVFR